MENEKEFEVANAPEIEKENEPEETEKAKDQMFNVADIVRRAKLAMGFSRDSELAKYLGVSRSTMSNWMARNSIDFPLVLGRMQEVDYNWLLTGKGSPRLQQGYCDSELASGPVERIHQPKCSEALDDRSVTLFNFAAAANLRSMLEDRPQYALGEIVIPNIPRCDGAIFISGDSMYPILKSGDIVGFRCIPDFNAIIYGEMYLLSFTIDGDDYVTIKYLQKADEEGFVRLVSYNPHHSPKDIPVDSIRALALVKASVRFNTMG